MLSIYDDVLIKGYFVTMVFILGVVFGSFLNCAAYRVSHGASFIKGRSQCTSCGHELAWYDLIPIISWLSLKGRCRYCKEKISVRYPLTELTLGILLVLVLLRFDLTWLSLRNMILTGILFFLALVDLEIYMIPDSCHVLSILVWLIFAVLLKMTGKEIISHLISLFVYGGGMLGFSLLFDRLLKKESLGGGDVKLFGVMGLYLGLIPSLFGLFFACIIGLLMVVIQMKMNPERGTMIPFGPAIALALWGMLLYGMPLVNWYLGLLM